MAYCTSSALLGSCWRSGAGLGALLRRPATQPPKPIAVADFLSSRRLRCALLKGLWRQAALASFVSFGNVIIRKVRCVDGRRWIIFQTVL
jgi:hypothetical protein